MSWGYSGHQHVDFLVVETPLVAVVAARMGAVVVALGLWSSGSVVVAHGLGCSTECGIFRPGIELVSPALPGGLLT